MRFNNHSNLEGMHAFLSASKYHWLRYNDDKLIRSFTTAVAAARGTKLHEYAAMAIKLGQKQPRTETTINRYINDAIGFRMSPERVLVYSRNAFGTADAISFRRERANGRFKLRIHDLKTGTSSTASMDQLLVYAAMFCFEYDKSPKDIDIELRIYQNDEIIIHTPDLDEMIHTMDRVKMADRLIEQLREEEEL